jgi:hypothetical protein
MSPHSPLLQGSPRSGDSAVRLCIIAACVVGTLGDSDRLSYLVQHMHEDRRDADLPTESRDLFRHGNLKLPARFVDRAAQEVIAMKLIIAAAAAVFALSSPALAQDRDFSTDGLNGSTLGKSMRGVNNGVPYPNTNLTGGAAPAGGGSWRYHRQPRHHHWHHWHHRYHRHHKH